MVRFGDVAERVNTKEDRFNTDLVYYVGGDHIESNALTVSGRGKIKEADLGPMFYFGFKPGDILFVTRNPHLRKCALVNFSGICSEKTLVIGTKDENVLSQNYLATVMQSDDFWEFMEENKSGSVNYFVNWTTLADYEFNLPSLARQHELADLIWAANDLKESYKKAITATDEMLKAKFREMFGNCPQVSLASVCKGSGEYGIAASAGDYDVKKGRYIRITDIMDDGSLNDDVVSPDKYEEKFILKEDDILFARTGNTVGKTYIHKRGHATFAGYLIRYEVDQTKMLPDYLFAYTHTDEYYFWVAKTKKIGAQPNINAMQYDGMTLPCPSLALQREFVAIADKAESAKANLKKSIAAIDQVMKGLINQ